MGERDDDTDGWLLTRTECLNGFNIGEDSEICQKQSHQCPR